MNLTNLPESLERLFTRKGWYNIYLRHIPDLQQPNLSNECYARSPFRDINDNNPSFSVNAGNGLFNCFRTGRSGNYINFRQYIDSTYTGPDGMIIPIDYKLTLENVMREEGIVPPSEEWIQNCHNQLIGSEEAIRWIQQFKSWFLETFIDLQIGYDWETSSIVIPIRDEEGKIINARMYNPTGEPKMRWLVNGLTGNYIYPHFALSSNEDLLILVEGETKVLTLRSLGFNAISGTVGATSPVPPGNWHRNRQIAVWMDEDVAGEQARQKAINALRNTATEVRSIRLPDWEGKPSHADACDYVRYLMMNGLNQSAIINHINALIEESEIVSSLNTVYDVKPKNIKFSDLLSSEQVYQRIRFIGRVSATSERRYIGLTRYNLNCPGRGHTYCGNCIMNQRYNGHAEFYLDRRSPDQLKMISVNDQIRLTSLQKINGIPIQCPSVDVEPIEWTGYEPTEISASLMEEEINQEVNDTERHRREAYIIVQNGKRVEENRDYNFTGFLYPDPKTQSGIIVIDSSEPLETTAERFRVNEQIVEILKSFQPNDQNDIGEIIKLMTDRANDLSDSVTNIKGRLDLHLAMSLVFHSAIAFCIGNQKINRGWLELLIIGDTRSGKSATFRALANHYNMGVLIDCKNKSEAGLLGSVNTSETTGERYVTSGILPQNDKGIVCLDEMEGAKLGRAAMLEALASMRSEGIVRITKAAQAQYRARVRLICMANPGKGKLIKETGKTGSELILSLIPQPENIARFDAAMTVSQDDVPFDTINNISGLKEPAWSQEAQKLLLLWIHSRKSKQINFTEEAQQQIRLASLEMCEKYDPILPIVEPSDQRTRIAKWAVAIAGFCFSSTEDHEELIVTRAHVMAAKTLLEWFYDKPVMGYNRYSVETRRRRILEDEPAIRQAFDLIGVNKYKVAKKLLSLDEVSERAFRNIVHGPMALTVLNLLIQNNCLTLMYSGRKDSYERNPVFTLWLQSFIEEDTTF